MYCFSNLGLAASFAQRCCGPALLFDGPGGSGADFVVAIGDEARELEADGHAPYTLAETAKVGESRRW